MNKLIIICASALGLVSLSSCHVFHPGVGVHIHAGGHHGHHGPRYHHAPAPHVHHAPGVGHRVGHSHRYHR
ncbi:MAG: hypothetical protein II295_01635 [Akkermansia sp.]|nr:hypothetical protein [Akkermansia sp.]